MLEVSSEVFGVSGAEWDRDLDGEEGSEGEMGRDWDWDREVVVVVVEEGVWEV